MRQFSIQLHPRNEPIQPFFRWFVFTTGFLRSQIGILQFLVELVI